MLDNWVDQMNTQFLHPNTKLVDSELLSALWNVLKSPSQPTASHPIPNTLFTIPFKAMSILGKLGANNQVRAVGVCSTCHRLSRGLNEYRLAY